ncbi:MAG TPA: DMT family transporter [Candidatus Polarisedimenticolia bacterium]|jgi:drug/metabolite transporter (DMT)-like permease|nr:DMT family transporter [Candidatus Polarisedimenticolia bacterium]
MAAALGATLLWGMNFTIAKRVLQEVDPLAVAAARAAGGLLVFLVFLLLLDGPRGLAWPRLKRAAPLGLLGIFANQVFFIEGLKRTSASHSAVLIALLPLYVLLMSLLSRQERLTRFKAAGIAAAFGGVVLVAAGHGANSGGATLGGDLITMCGGIAFAAYTVAGRPVVRDLGPLRTTALAFAGGGTAILLVAAPAARRQEWRSLSPAAHWGLLYVVVGATVLAYVLYYLALDRLEPSKVAVFMYLQPVFAALLATFVTGEPLTLRFVTGGGLILAGVLIAERG